MSRKVMSIFMVALVLFASTSVLMPRAEAQAGGGNTGGVIIPIGTINGITGSGAFAGATSLVGSFNLQRVQVVKVNYKRSAP